VRLITTFILFISLISSPAFAVVDLELTQGVQGAIPIAVVPFGGQPADASSANNVAGVIHADLQNSGRFKAMPQDAMQQQPKSADQVNFSYWQGQNMNNLVVGNVESVGDGRYKVSFQLLNAYANKGGDKHSSAPAWQNAVLLSNSFTVAENQLRAVAHHISDHLSAFNWRSRCVFYADCLCNSAARQ
jgi:TolB protein